MLSKIEINLRMIELRNLRKLHTAQKITIGKLKEQVVLLKQENTLLRSANEALTHAVQDLKLQVEEMKTIVFGKKRKKEDDHDDVPPQPVIHPPRTRESYKRAPPSDNEITERKNHPIDACANCHGQFSQRDTVTYFEEDIPLPQKKTVIKHLIERGYCEHCKRWSTSVPLPVAPVILGRSVKRYVTYLSVICRQSYSQIQDLLSHTHDFGISQGEIAKILKKEGNRLRSEYERLKVRIRGEPSVHLDETGWDLFIGDGYRRFAWTMVGGKSAESVFILGKTRGKGNADNLLGNSRAVVVSDDLAVYKNMEQPHQLCCAHILRKLRDLALSGEIKNRVHDHCVRAYQTFAEIYAGIEHARKGENSAASYDGLHKQLQTFARAHQLDFKKLANIKNQIRERGDTYLTCLLYPQVASDNNAAERSLRHLVLKRKISFGSLSERTAETLAILLSVLLSLKQRGSLRGYLMGV